MVLLLAGCRGSKPERISAQMAYEGVSKYCHSEFDWRPAQSTCATTLAKRINDYIRGHNSL